MTTIIQQLTGLILGLGIGKVLWTGWESFRNRFLLASKEEKKKIKELKIQKRKLKAELKEVKKYYKDCYRRFEHLPLLVVKNEYITVYELFANHVPGLSKLDLIKLECSGKTLVKRMNLGDKITPEDLYNIICEEFDGEGKGDD